jgi:hypothetical protein
MSYDDPTPAASSGNKTVLIVVLVLVAAFLLIGAICGGAIWFLGKSVETMAETVEDAVKEAIEAQERQHAGSLAGAQAFIDDVRGNRLEQAYRATTPEFQRRTTLEDWQKLVAKYPGLTQATPGERTKLNRVNPFDQDGECEYEATIDLAPGKQARVRLTVREAEDKWKVDAIEISDRLSSK